MNRELKLEDIKIKVISIANGIKHESYLTVNNKNFLTIDFDNNKIKLENIEKQ